MAMGRPTKYDPKYCEEIIKFFDVPMTRTTIEKITTARGTKIVEKEVANYLPTLEKFAFTIGVTTDTIQEWKKQYEDFSVAVKKALYMQKDMLIALGLSGKYHPIFGIFVAKNLTDMVDRVETNASTNINLNLFTNARQSLPLTDVDGVDLPTTSDTTTIGSKKRVIDMPVE